MSQFYKSFACSLHTISAYLLFFMAIAFLPTSIFADFEPPLPTVKSVALSASIQIDGQPVKSPAVVAAGSSFTIAWRSQGVGCVSNWKNDILPASGSTVGSITASRPFIITCFGRGAAQSAALQVNVGVADLIMSSFSAVGLKAAKGGGRTRSYLALPFTLKSSVKNAGKLSVKTPFRVKYFESNDGQTGWISTGERTIAGVGGGATMPIEELPRQGNAGTEARYYKVCVDTESQVAESKEDNNCSKVLGPYSFVPAP